MRARMFVGILVAAAGTLSAPAAYAATANDSTQFAVTAGALAFATAPDAPNFSGVTLNGQAQTATATMNGFTVVDATGSGSGWNTTVVGDSSGGHSAVFKQYCPNANCGSDSLGYVSGGETMAADSLVLSSTGAAFNALLGTTGTAPTHQCASGCNVDHGSAVKVASAAVNAGMGTFAAASYGASSLSLSLPTTLKSLPANEVYRVDLVWSLTSGP